MMLERLDTVRQNFPQNVSKHTYIRQSGCWRLYEASLNTAALLPPLCCSVGFNFVVDHNVYGELQCLLWKCSIDFCRAILKPRNRVLSGCYPVVVFSANTWTLKYQTTSWIHGTESASLLNKLGFYEALCTCSLIHFSKTLHDRLPSYSIRFLMPAELVMKKSSVG